MKGVSKGSAGLIRGERAWEALGTKQYRRVERVGSVVDGLGRAVRRLHGQFGLRVRPPEGNKGSWRGLVTGARQGAAHHASWLCEVWHWGRRGLPGQTPVAAVASRTSRAMVVRLYQTSAWKMMARPRGWP